ncbi:Crp/Fnr family transcriptional regulator [Bacteroidota bacterium]
MKLFNENSATIHYKKGEIICKQGGLSSHVLLMEKGLAKAYMENSTNTLILKLIPDGGFIGLGSVSKEQNTYQYSAKAFMPSEIRQINISVFRQLLKQNFDFSKDVIDILSSNSVQVYGRFFCMTHKQAFGRLADIILCLSDRVFKKPEFELSLSRKDLADLSGMSSGTVIRMLGKFQDDGLIFMQGKNFKVLDYKKLKRISETG